MTAEITTVLVLRCDGCDPTSRGWSQWRGSNEHELFRRAEQEGWMLGPDLDNVYSLCPGCARKESADGR